jgi:transcriptional regulator
MYPMPEFQETDTDAILEFIRKYPLGMLTGIGESGKIVATHVPMIVQAGLSPVRLRGHVMRKTEYWKGFKANPDVLVAFTGPDAPILESWMERRPFGGTWNYMSVHVRGRLKFLPQEHLVEFLQSLKDSYEVDPAAKFEHLSDDYLNALLPAIEVFEIEAEDIQAVFKLSQNRSFAEFKNATEQLLLKGGEFALVAEEMLSRTDSYFPGSTEAREKI